MNHSRYKGRHNEAGYKWSKSVLKNKGKITDCHTFKITKERKEFAKECISVYKKYFPEILDEIKGIADGQKISLEDCYSFIGNIQQPLLRWKMESMNMGLLQVLHLFILK